MNFLQNNTIQKFLKNDATTLVLRLALLYLLWFLCRIVFYLQNAADIGTLTWSEVPELLHGAWMFDTASILYINALFILLSLLPLRLRERKWYQQMLFWLYTVTNSLALLINTADGIYFHYARKRFTSDELSYLHNNDNTGTVLLRGIGENWYIVLWFALLIFGMIWCYRRIKPMSTRIHNPWGYLGVNLAILAVGVGFVLGGIRGGFSRQTRPITLSNATLYTASNLKANLILSNPFCVLRTLGNKALVYEKFFDQATLDSLYSPYHYPSATCDTAAPSSSTSKGSDIATTDQTTNEATIAPVLGKRNIVLFILESFSSEHSALLNPDLYPDGNGFTPFLDSLMRNGYYFTNAFANGRKSIEALPSVLSSIPSYETPFVLLPQAVAPIKALPKILHNEGYATSFFNGSSRGSMGFGAYATQAGIENYYSREDYERAHGTDDFDGYWGIWDEPFLQYMGLTLNSTPQPFFASVFTLTSHHPFVVPDQYKEELPAGKTKVHKGVAYTDLAIRHFMEAASKQPWYNNTIFVFVADHVSSETFAPKTLTPTGNSHIICLLYTPDGALKGADTRVTQQIDLMPTLLGLVGYDRPYFAFGRDVLRENDHPAMAVNRMGENYQAITDSLVLFFDGHKTLSAYTRADTLQKHNIAVQTTPALEQVERDLKARLQQYYQHVEKSDYLVKEHNEKP